MQNPLPDLDAWAFDSLCESIRKYGVLLPIIRDEKGKTLDGFQRLRACKKLGVKNYPIITLKGLSAAEKRDHALLLNLCRRQLTRKALRALIVVELCRRPTVANKSLAVTLGTSHQTVQSVRAELERGGKISPVQQREGRDGKTYRPATRIISNTPGEHKLALKSIAHLTKPGLLVDTITARRRAKHIAAKPLADNSPVDAKTLATFGVHCCRFQELSLKANSVDLVFCDPPWQTHFLPELGELAAWAKRCLKPGGTLAVYSGVRSLPEVLPRLAEHLQYVTVGCSSWAGAGSPMTIGKSAVINLWRPVIIFSKGPWRHNRRWPDCFHSSEAKDKQYHEYQQPLGVIKFFVQMLSSRGSLVVDPTAGSYTTGVACKELGRRFVGCDPDRRTAGIAAERLGLSSAKRKRSA